MLMQRTSWMVFSLTAVAAIESSVAGPRTDAAQLRHAGLARYWEAQVPLAPGDSIEAADLVDEVLYITTSGGSVFSVTADVGLIRWGTKLTRSHYRIYTPAHMRRSGGAGPVIIPTTDEFYILDRYSGDVLRSFRPDFPPTGAAIGAEGLVFTGSTTGRFYALLVDYPCASDPITLWQVETRGAVVGRPIFHDIDKLVFVSRNGTVYSCSALDKVLSWSISVGGSIVADPVLADGGVYVASLNRSLYKVDAATGEAVWRVRFPAPLVDSPAIVDHTVYQYSSDQGMTALDAETGRERWRSPSGRAIVAHWPKSDVLFTTDRALHVVDRKTGRLRGSAETHGVSHAVTNVGSDAVYLVGRDGGILCLRPADRPFLRPRDMAAARRRLNRPPRSASDASAHIGIETFPDDDSSNNDPLRSRHDPPG